MTERLGSVTTGNPPTCPTTHWESTSVRIPAALSKPFPSGMKSGLLELSKRLKSLAHLRGVLTHSIVGSITAMVDLPGVSSRPRTWPDEPGPQRHRVSSAAAEASAEL